MEREALRLCQHEDFQEIIAAAAEQLDLGVLYVEKDYYVTEALRISAVRLGDHVVFKGGTSLSKGWNLLKRFSEDIDLFLDPDSYDNRLGQSRTDSYLKKPA